MARTDKPFRVTGSPNNASPASPTLQGSPSLGQLQGTAQMVGPMEQMPPLQTPTIPFRIVR